MPEVRLIDANALDGHKFPAYGATLDARERGWNECIEYLKARAKTIEAAPVVHARWEPIDWTGVGIYKMWQCSACKNGSTVGGETGPDIPYCFSCGAKMDGGASNA